MTLDGFLTLLALLVAIYALLPKSSSLLLRIGVRYQYLMAVTAFLIIFYVHFNTQAVSLCREIFGYTCDRLPSISNNPTSLTAPQLSFLIVCIWGLMACAIYKIFSRPKSTSPLPVISKIVDDLIYKQRYAELIDIVEPRLPTIDKAINRLLFLQKLHDKVRLLGNEEHQYFLGDSGRDPILKRLGLPSMFIRKIDRTVSKLASIIPAYYETQAVAANIIRSLCQSKGLTKYVIKVRPLFALPLIRLPGTDAFCDAYFRGLISDTDSILYQELESNSVRSPGIRPREGNHVLGFLFNDALIAERLGVWKPVGDYMVELLKSDQSSEFIETLNRKTNYSYDECWEDSDPIWAGICFFDIMVTAAAMQGIRWHMWLYYFTHIVGGLVKIYDTSSPEVDESYEFPIKSARLIYEAITAVRGWILLIDKLPHDSPHRNSAVLQRQGDQQVHPIQRNDNANIPVSAANVLGICMRKIFLSPNIGQPFKSYIYEIILKTLVKLENENCRLLLIHCIVDGGLGYDIQESMKHEYGRILKDLRTEIDLLLWEKVPDLAQRIEQAYG